MWSMPHTTLIDMWDDISIPLTSSLDCYTTDGGTWFKLLDPTTSVIDDHSWVVVGGDTVVCGVGRPCQIWHMSHITLIKQ